MADDQPKIEYRTYEGEKQYRQVGAEFWVKLEDQDQNIPANPEEDKQAPEEAKDEQ